MIRVLVVDDHAIVRAGICRLLEGQADLDAVGECSTGEAAVRLCGALRPDVAVLELSLPDLSVLETTRRIVRQAAGTSVVVLAFHAHHEYLTRLVRAGATGFATKTAPPSILLEAIRKTARRGFYVEPAVMDRMMGGPAWQVADAPEAELSNRELQVLARLARGQETREVAAALQLSRSTIDSHRGRILKKLKLRNNSDLTRFAIRRGLIDAD
jgi:DNA-binding NarL/FixJ family response regulator